MRIPAIVVAFCVALAGVSHANPDPLNWCPPTPEPSSPPLNVPLQQAFTVDAPNFTAGTFTAGQVIAELSVHPLAPRILSAPRPELGLANGAQLTPMNVVGSGSDALSQLSPVYCATAEPTGVCLGEVNETHIARSAIRSHLDAAAGDPPMLTGVYSIPRRDLPTLGRNQDWGSLVEEGPIEASFTRTLTLDAVETVQHGATFDQPAYQSVRLHLTFASYPSFTRGLNEPIRVGNHWLVATAATADSVTFERMTGLQRMAVAQERCPPRRAPS
jgi:hypothetical protein